MPDSSGQSCVPVVDCKVSELKPLPADDVCAQVLENIHSTQAQKDAACGSLTPELKDGIACFSDKLSHTNDIVSGNPIPLKITSDIRDIAYQAHLREIWDKMKALVALDDDPVQKNACAARRSEIAAEKGCNNAGPYSSDSCETASAEGQRSHCIKSMPASPSPNDAQHTQGKAFDASDYYTVAPLQAALNLRSPPETISQFLDAPTNCNLIWGGTFKTNKDFVHFYAP